jgi:hypothetical protein
MIQALFCENGGHYYDRIATRGRQARSCVDHDGTGIPTKTYRAGSKAGEQAFAQRGGLLKERAAAPRSVPVRKVAGSDSGDKESRTRKQSNGLSIARLLGTRKRKHRHCKLCDVLSLGTSGLGYQNEAPSPCSALSMNG